jgi:CheY-specific phosphatase CheX
MQPLSTTTLTAIFSEVLANLAFMFTDEDQAAACAEDTWLETVISYEGSANGTLRFRCTRSFSFLLAANLLGVDPSDDVPNTTADDAVREFMNIVCGQFVTAVHGTQEVFNLTIPRIKELSETPDISDDNSPDSSALSVEGRLVQLSYVPGVSDEAC